MGHRPRLGHAAAAMTVGRTLLVVDDDAANRTLLHIFFAKKGFAVREARDGDEGLQMARARDVDVVLLDQMMPGKTGLEVLRILRAENNAVPIVMLTGDSHADTAIAAMAAGADDHVTKPCSLPVLLARVERRVTSVVHADPEIVEVQDPHADQVILPPVPAGAPPVSWANRLAGLKNKLLRVEPPGPQLQPGAIISGRYRLDAPIGKGKMGAVVWRARHIELDLDVALKVLPRDSQAMQPGESARDSFRREGLMLARVKHRHIVRALDAGLDVVGGNAWLVLELLQGESVRVKMVRDGGVVPVHIACGVAADVCAALAACHRHGVIHRDVKAWSVLLANEDPDQTPVTKLCDFGAACAIDDVKQQELLVGTPSHMAPERFDQPRATPESDVYAVGILLHQLLTGTLPFIADDAAGLARLHQSTRPPTPSATTPDLPAGVDDTVGRLLRKNPPERPSAHEAAVLLRSIARSQLDKEKRARPR